MDELYRSENLVVRRVPSKDQKRWVVTFDHYGIGHGFDREAFAEEFLKSQGISAIHVMGRAEDWYQYPDIDTALATAKAALTQASRVMTYGSSMGAYAAVRFADAVGAHVVLALSPQYSIDPAVAPFETRWQQDVCRIDFQAQLNGPITSQARTIIAYDPSLIDRRHVGLIEGDIRVDHLRTPYAGHPSGPFLGEIGVLPRLVINALDGTVDLPAVRKSVRAKRSGSAIYNAHLAAAFPERRRELAIRIARQAVKAAPDSVYALEQLARLLSQGGSHDEALALHHRALDASQQHYTSQIAYADTLTAAGRPAEALKVAEQIMLLDEVRPMAHLHAWTGEIAWKSGNYAKASRSLQRAIQLHPESPEYPKLLKRFAPPRHSSSLNHVIRNIGPRAQRWLRRLGGATDNKSD